MKSPKEACPVCAYKSLERGYLGHPHGIDSGETECPRCLAQHALDDDGYIEFTYSLPGVPLPRDRWIERA